MIFFSFFRSDYCSLNFAFCYFFIFFRFRVTWPGNRVRGNLPIDFEIMILNFERMYGLSYIKRKHVICWFQKHALTWNSKLVVKILVTFRYEWSKWPFCTKMIWSGHVTHQSKAYELNIPKNLFRCNKMLLGATSGGNQFFEKSCDDVTITLNDQSWLKNIRIQLI